jgi:hypothetical protein
MRVAVCGMVAGDPHQGGASWAVLQYVLGLRRLGHDVVLVEPVTAPSRDAVEYFGDVVRAFGLEGRAALLDRAGRRSIGMARADVTRLVAGADLLLNLSGRLRVEELDGAPPVRVFVDLDPAFTQLWQASGVDVGLAGHTHHATVGWGIGRPGSPVPNCGVDWVHTLPPVVLERWPVAREVVHDALTTVGHWRSYGSVERDGVHYGQRAHSLRLLISLPTRTTERLVLALGIHRDERADLAALAEHRWRLADPLRMAGDPGAYQRFVAGSRGELGIAKSGYVLSRSGWFSDRSACYLASGRPVLAQDTGFGDVLPTGEGLLAFTTVDDAVAGIEALREEPERHARAARRIAEEHLDSDRVLGRLLEAVGV